MSKVFKVLVFPGGTEIGLEINRALRDCKDIKLFSAGLDISNHAPYVFARHFTIPSIFEPGWIDALNERILEHEIDYVFPAYDDVIVALAENAEKIKSGIVSSPLQTCLITRSKSRTYHVLENTLPVPRMWEDVKAIDQYPVFVKPEKGQGSQRAFVASNPSQLSRLLEESPDYIVTEYLPGDRKSVV